MKGEIEMTLEQFVITLLIGMQLGQWFTLWLLLKPKRPT